MANVNTVFNFPNLPSQTIATANAVLLTPAAGVYPGLPSPVFAAASALTLTPNDTITGGTFDNKQFVVRVMGMVTIGASNSTFTPSLYIGSSTTVGSNTSIGAGTTSASLTAATAYPFILEAHLEWNSVTTKLTGWYTQSVNGVLTAGPTATTSTTAATISALSFVPTFAFGTTQAGNAVQVSEFAIDKA